MIKTNFGIAYRPCHLWKLLGRMGWSAQKPERRAREQDEAAVREWREKEWPRIKRGRAAAAVA